MTLPLWIDAPSPFHGGVRWDTTGVIVHSTRGDGGDREFQATLNWFQNPVSEVSAHVVISRDGRWARCVDDRLLAWHAGVHNATYLGVELEQATPQDEYTDRQYFLLSAWILSMHQIYGFLLDREHILGHDETYQGKQQGKIDPGSLFNWKRLMGLLLS